MKTLPGNLVYGLHSVKQFLSTTPHLCITLFHSGSRNPRLQQLLDQAKSTGIDIQQVDKSKLDQWSEHANHQGCVLQVKDSDAQKLTLESVLQTVTQDDVYLVLDGVQDPHNLGACLRTADAAGVKAVIVPKDRATGLTPVVRKVAAGAAEQIPLIQVTNLERALKQMQQAGVWLVATSGEASQSFYDLEFDRATGLVMGAEGKGVRRLTRERCDFEGFLPMQGVVESLNVSVATGVCLYEILRQKRTLSA